MYIPYKTLKEEFEKNDTVSKDHYNVIFDHLTFDEIIYIWNNVNKNIGLDENIIYYSKELHKDIPDNEHKCLIEAGIKMMPYYLLNDGKPDYYNAEQLELCLGISDEVYEWEYDVLTYVFNENIYVQT